MKETGDAKRVHDHIMRCFEEASFIHMLDGDEDLSAEEEAQIREVLSFVVVGGGPTGTEFCAEMTDLLKTDIAKQYPHLSTLWSVHLIDALPAILGPFQDPELQEYARAHLTEKQGVQIHLNEFVDTVTANEIKLKSGKKFPFSTLVWCAGIKPIPFVADLELKKNERGSQLLTDGQLRVKGEERNGIYAMGDCATIEGNWLPQTAQIASQQAIYLAQKLNSSSSTSKLSDDYPPFEHNNKGVLAYLGGTTAVYGAPKGLPKLTGFLGYFTWRSAYWSMQLSMRNRVMLAWNWTSNAMFGRDLTRVGRYSTPVPKAEPMERSVSGSSQKR